MLFLSSLLLFPKVSLCGLSSEGYGYNFYPWGSYRNAETKNSEVDKKPPIRETFKNCGDRCLNRRKPDLSNPCAVHGLSFLLKILSCCVLFLALNTVWITVCVTMDNEKNTAEVQRINLFHYLADWRMPKQHWAAETHKTRT